MAIVLQALSARLGVGAGQDLAEASRDAWPRAAPVLWCLAEIAVAATDLAELLGSAIALELLLGIPIAAGVALTAADVLVLLGLERRGVRRLEAAVLALVLDGGGELRLRAGSSATPSPRRPRGVPPGRRALPRRADALPGRRHPRRHGDAAQPLPPLQPGQIPRPRRGGPAVRAPPRHG